jgi:hypothetical protein
MNSVKSSNYLNGLRDYVQEFLGGGQNPEFLTGVPSVGYEPVVANGMSLRKRTNPGLFLGKSPIIPRISTSIPLPPLLNQPCARKLCAFYRL